MAVIKCVTESVFIWRLRQNFTVNGSDSVCDGICFYKVQTFTINGSHKVCDGVCFNKVFQAITVNRNAQLRGRFCDRFCF